ncbi:hypothetical protein AOQ84DRAFT_382833 [Glonium stellatum]|uniref:Uncharacterized protein n=1 Tax=Glonium stellatum TaxID=574774 RepID=A0A8E2JML2_9PEZI|nr:hypothetical protein AOQ84DRAFT_382833 [Glonium stellatum]
MASRIEGQSCSEVTPKLVGSAADSAADNAADQLSSFPRQADGCGRINVRPCTRVMHSGKGGRSTGWLGNRTDRRKPPTYCAKSGSIVCSSMKAQESGGNAVWLSGVVVSTPLSRNLKGTLCLAHEWFCSDAIVNTRPKTPSPNTHTPKTAISRRRAPRNARPRSWRCS